MGCTGCGLGGWAGLRKFRFWIHILNLGLGWAGPGAGVGWAGPFPTLRARRPAQQPSPGRFVCFFIFGFGGVGLAKQDCAVTAYNFYLSCLERFRIQGLDIDPAAPTKGIDHSSHSLGS